MRKLLLGICCLLASHIASATHIVGGELTYKYLYHSGNSDIYQLNLSLYVDCINGQPGAIAQDETANFNVFDAATGQLLTFLCVNKARLAPVRVSETNYKCIKTIPNACVDYYQYQTNITLPFNANGYIVTFERCCRNNTISNILSPESTGATYWTEIKPPSVIGKNSSPVFKSLPPNFLCTNAPLVFNHSATDADGDSLVYELFTPFVGGTDILPRPDYANSSQGTPVYPNTSNREIIWTGIYSQINMMGGQPILTIDRFTGRLTVTPDQVGQFVVGIKVIEYRKGVVIGETKRDYQFNVSECTFSVVSSFFVPTLNCAEKEISFNNQSAGAIKYRWDFGDPGKNSDTSLQVNPKYTYPKSGVYKVQLVASASTCVDTFDYYITVKPAFKASLGKDTLFCFAVSKTLSAGIPNKKYYWSTGENTQTITVNKPGRYWVTASETPCSASDTINILLDNTSVNLGPDSVICRDSFIQFTYGGPKGIFQSYTWNDGTTLPSVFISKLGTYWVNVATKNNCISSDTITFVLYPPPKSGLKDTIICYGDNATFNVENKDATYLWNTGETTPVISASAAGEYKVMIRNKLCTIYDTVTVSNYELDLDLGPDTFYCGPVNRVLNAGIFSKYLWHDGSTNPVYIAISPGIKKVTVTNPQGCQESDSVNITSHPPLVPKLQGDTSICLSSTIVLTANDSMAAYLWNTGEKTQSVRISSAGLYFVILTDNLGCISRDSLMVIENPNALPNELFMPNAFTPNDDRLNDLYPGNRYQDPGATYNLKLFNRWGEKIFDTDKPSVQWDGTYKGEIMPQDVYVYLVTYVGCDNTERTFRGTFTLIR